MQIGDKINIDIIQKTLLKIRFINISVRQTSQTTIDIARATYIKYDGNSQFLFILKISTIKMI